MFRRRLIVVVTLLCVAWATLWPLVSAAHSLLSDTQVPLCHQAGQAVPIGIGQVPDGDGAPSGGAKVHCPLCIMAFFAAFEPPLEAPPALFFTTGVALQAHCAAVPAGIEVPLPQGRAPPLPLAS
ncbi:MAG TPA: DUF2946 family protein [Usitatibacteraceae bacterium]|nr:DUF2946 family protein [Usitatibacteraceae bacterium]